MTIAQVSQKYGVSADTLRYYERIGLIPPVHRSAGDSRDYDETDCGWVEFIKCMRAAGLPIEALIEYVALFQQGDDTLCARKALLLEQREQLAQRIADLQAVLDRLDRKIQVYDEKCVAMERLLRRP